MGNQCTGCCHTLLDGGKSRLAFPPWSQVFNLAPGPPCRRPDQGLCCTRKEKKAKISYANEAAIEGSMMVRVRQEAQFVYSSFPFNNLHSIRYYYYNNMRNEPLHTLQIRNLVVMDGTPHSGMYTSYLGTSHHNACHHTITVSPESTGRSPEHCRPGAGCCHGDQTRPSPPPTNHVVDRRHHKVSPKPEKVRGKY